MVLRNLDVASSVCLNALIFREKIEVIFTEGVRMCSDVCRERMKEYRNLEINEHAQ